MRRNLCYAIYNTFFVSSKKRQKEEKNMFHITATAANKQTPECENIALLNKPTTLLPLDRPKPTTPLDKPLSPGLTNANAVNANAVNADAKCNADAAVNANANAEPNEKDELVRELTLRDLVLMGLGNVVGAGVFVIIGKSILYGGNKTVHALVVVTAFSILMGLVYLEAYSRHQSDITEYLTIQSSFGDGVGTIAMYLIYLFAVLSGVTITISLAKYIFRGEFWGGVKGSDKGSDKGNDKGNKQWWMEFGFIVVILGIMSGINYAGIKTSKVVGNSIAVIMLLVLGGVVAFGARHICWDPVFVTPPSVPWESLSLSAILSLFLFNGYDFIVKISNETKNPEDNKTALILTILITAAIYIGVILTALCVLRYKTAGATYNLISKIYERLFSGGTGKAAALVSYVAGAFIMFNTAFLSLMSSTRFLYGYAAKKLGAPTKAVKGEENLPEPFYTGTDKAKTKAKTETKESNQSIETESIETALNRWWAKLSPNNTPTYAIAVTFVLAAALSLFNNEVVLTVFSNFAVLVILFLLCAALLKIRWAERGDGGAQQAHNYIPGSVSNIPLLVLVAMAGILYTGWVILTGDNLRH
jgi:amino acid transporter